MISLLFNFFQGTIGQCTQDLGMEKDSADFVHQTICGDEDLLVVWMHPLSTSWGSLTIGQLQSSFRGESDRSNLDERALESLE